MPAMPPRPCTQPRCRSLAIEDGRCADHKREPWASNKGRSRHERGYGNDWEKQRKAALERDTFLCQQCIRLGIVRRATQVDHIIPKSQGGSNSSGNLESICDSCHTSKTVLEATHGRSRKNMG